MDLYRKKVNVEIKPSSGKEENYEDSKYNPSKRPKNIYLQNDTKQNQPQFCNDLIDEYQPGKNIPSTKENVVSDENNKPKSIKYPNSKTRNFQNPEENQVQRDLERSISPKGNRKRPLDYGGEGNIETSPIRKVLNLSREPYYSEVGKRFNTKW